ncbi:Membralin [Geodia barretti]|uniref:Membralin n=1 Tax=Geodia barretti TaxID=519541 RepID=A0AA35WQL0_GEOBA|nr:Membralin [Geodia barretti]
MDREVILRRNVAFNVIYRRITYFYPRFVHPIIRWLMEVTFLLLAILTLSLWSYVHMKYVVEQEDCLTDIKDRPFSFDVILQVEVYSNTTELYYFAKKYSSQSTKNMTTSTLKMDGENYGKDTNAAERDGESDQNKSEQLSINVEHDGYEQLSLFEILDIYTLKLYSVDYTILEFSQEPGYLSLSHSARAHLNITTRHLYIDPENNTCFGGGFGRFITKYILGYEMMIIASFKNLLPASQGSGYVKNLVTGSHYYYRVQWMGKWRYIAGLLPTFFFTLVASVLLRQIHYHGFKFLTHFHHLLNEGIPMPIQTGAQVPFLIITYAAIGFSFYTIPFHMPISCVLMDNSGSYRSYSIGF